MHKRFNHNEIEKKWQEKWLTDNLYDVGERDSAKEKEYVLVEWPYPSGNLHIGHWYAFAVPDIYVRYQRMNGKQVLFPMGFDSFGLPAENAAIKHKLNPREWTEANISHMTNKQLSSMGNAFSWDKTTSSIDPDYYKWTQWMFTKFYINNIAYRGEGIVNWCSGCNTVIANEQVQTDNTCERCDSSIEKKKMPQWMLKITDFADDLIDDLESLDWPEHIKDAQRNWIGRSKGAKITFKLSLGEEIEVFTTRPDTLYGATYVVLAPEHDLVQKHRKVIKNWEEVKNYIDVSKQRDERDRLDNTKDKTGVKLEGITATNPASGEVLPVYIADYVLAGYGTGAIMAVPAHDERDFEFAIKFDLKIKQVVHTAKDLPSADAGTLMNSDEFNGMTTEEAKTAITKKVGGATTSTYRLRNWSIGRQRYWGVPIPIIYDPTGKAYPVPEEHLPWTLPEDVDFTPTGEAPLAKSEELKQRTEDIFGKGWTPEVETMDTFVDSSWYYLRYLDSHNANEFVSKEALEDWMPVDLYFGGAEHTTMHLLYSRFWHKALFRLGLVAENEPYIKRINRGLILGPDGNKMSKSKGNVIDPDQQVENVGADTVKMYLAFMGPYGEGANYPWDMGGIAGIKRFLERSYGLLDELQDKEIMSTTKLLHKTIKKLREDITQYKFNTAISALMVFVNHAEKEGIGRDSYSTFITLLAPFSPHLAEEIWLLLGNHTSVHLEKYPTFDPDLVQDEQVTLGVQVNGKMRGQITLAPDSSEDEAVSLAKQENNVKARVEGKELIRIIYKPGRILNLIIKE